MKQRTPYSSVAMARNLDMFSFLPESLLTIIVSFLPFKEAARTCILSKQWEGIWKSTKSIEFNELFFVKIDDDENREAQRRVFIKFITEWISTFKEPVLEKFSLKVSAPLNIRDTVERCVAFVTEHKVKELGLDFSDPKLEENNIDNDDIDDDALFELPNKVYENELIESLKLYACNFVMPKLHNFQVLKDVSLGYIEVSIYALKTLLTTCKRIENLSLKKCRNLEHFDMGDENLGLRRLIIDKCDFSCDYFLFNAPNLKYLKYSGLVGAFDINVSRYVMEETEIDFALMPQYDEFGNQLYKLLEDLYPVRVLTIDSFLLQVIPTGEEPMRIKCGLNVRHLIMKTQMHPHELCGFRFLLFSCPMLEKLTLEIDLQIIFHDSGAPYKVNLKNFWHEPQPIYRCLRRTLKVVEVKKFRGSLDELLALQYLILAGQVLEKININVRNDEQAENHRALARNLLLIIPRASKNLQISIV